MRSKNVTMQLTKNIALFSIAAIMYWLVGFNMMYPGDGLADLGLARAVLLHHPHCPPRARRRRRGGHRARLCLGRLGLLLPADCSCAPPPPRCLGHPGRAHEALAVPRLRRRADRFHLPDRCVLAVGWRLAVPKSGFSDFAGSTWWHAAGGFAALAGALILVGRGLGKYAKDGKVNPMPGSNTRSADAVWPTCSVPCGLGWVRLLKRWSQPGDWAPWATLARLVVARIWSSSKRPNMAAALRLRSQPLRVHRSRSKWYGKGRPDQGSETARLAGLVSSPQGPLDPSLFGAPRGSAPIGRPYNVVVTVTDARQPQDRRRGPRHPGAPIVGFGARWWCGAHRRDILRHHRSSASVSIGAFVFVTSLIVWLNPKAVMGLRVSEEAEINGPHVSETGHGSLLRFHQRVRFRRTVKRKKGRLRGRPPFSLGCVVRRNDRQPSA